MRRFALNVLHVIHSIDPRSGGPSHALRGLVREQVRRGHRVTVLATTVQSAEPWEVAAAYEQRMRDDPDLAGAETTLIKAWGRRRVWRRFGYAPASREWLRSSFVEKAVRPDVVHIHGAFSDLTHVAARQAHRYGVPYIVRPAGCLDADCIDRRSRRLKEWFARVWLQDDMRQAAFVQAMSGAEAEQLKAWATDEQLVSIPHGIELPTLCPLGAADPEAAALAARYPQLAGGRVVLFMARIDSKKRPELIVEALAMLRDEHPDLRLLVAGCDAGHLAALQETIGRLRMNERVAFAGFLQGADKSAAYRAARLCALPSKDENFGVTVIEAMAHGTPMLVTPGVANHVHVDASGGGLTVEPTREAVAEGIRRLLSMDRDALGAKGRIYVAENLTWTGVANRLDELYRRCAPEGTSTMQPDAAHDLCIAE
jgi:glycosyltransferase involved in cell wall biosynthesis